MNDFHYPFLLLQTTCISTWGQWIILLNPPLLKWIHFGIRRFDFVFLGVLASNSYSCHCFESCLIETPSSPSSCKYFKHNLFIINKEQGSATEQRKEE